MATKPRYKKTHRWKIKQLRAKIHQELQKACIPFLCAVKNTSAQVALTAEAAKQLSRAITKNQKLRIAEILGADEQAVNKWLNEHPDFCISDLWNWVMSTGKLPTPHEINAVRMAGVDLVSRIVIAHPNVKFSDHVDRFEFTYTDKTLIYPGPIFTDHLPTV
jgi:hypothetical protein